MKTDITVQNLKCGGCGNTIANKLTTLEGITDVVINTEKSKVTFSYGTNENLNTAEKTLINLGYPPEGVENKIITKAKSFVSCASGKFN